VKRKAPKQKPLTKSIGPIGDHVAKKMKTWDVIAKQTNYSNEGLSNVYYNVHKAMGTILWMAMGTML
jgi:hypothetical protein